MNRKSLLKKAQLRLNLGSGLGEKGRFAKVFMKVKDKKARAENKTRKLDVSAVVATSWNSSNLFLLLGVGSVLVYSVVQLATSVFLDDQSKYLQTLREEEAYYLEENQDLESRIARYKSLSRVQIAAKEDLKLREANGGDYIYVSGGDLSAELR